MTARRCLICGAVIFGRADKRYCSATCRRDASRIRRRDVRIGTFTYFGSELTNDAEIELLLIPYLERELGPNHRAVREARRRAEAIREADQRRLRKIMQGLAWHRASQQDDF